MELLKYAFIFFATGLIGLLITWLINKDRNSVTQCKMGLGIGILYLICIFVFVTLAIASSFPNLVPQNIFAESDSNDYWVGPLFAGMTLLSAYALIDGLFRVIQWDKNGLTVTNLVSPSRSYIWRDVVTVNYKFIYNSWELGFSDGYKFHFSDWMSGAYAFIAACEEHASPKSNMKLLKYIGR